MQNLPSVGNMSTRYTGIFKEDATSQNIMSSTTSPKCQVCGDTAAGVHYGAVTCHGCRAFFRRGANSKFKYICHFYGRCVVNASARMKCKACRYKRCLQVGMKSTDYVNQDKLAENYDSVNDEDPQAKRSKLDLPPYLDKDPLPQSPCAQILRNLQKVQDQVSRKFAPYFPKTGLRYCTSSQDFADGVTIELHYVVDWAKEIEIFKGVDTPSKVALLKGHCISLMFLEIARRWMDLEADDYFLGANGVMVPKFYGVKERGVANPKVFTEVLEPCRRMKVTQEEFLCLKALVMFNPNTDGLNAEDRWKLGYFQRQIKLLMVTNGHDRMWNLLMLLPTLCAVAENFKEVMRNRSIIEDIKPCKIMRELLLDN